MDLQSRVMMKQMTGEVGDVCTISGQKDLDNLYYLLDCCGYIADKGVLGFISKMESSLRHNNTWTLTKPFNVIVFQHSGMILAHGNQRTIEKCLIWSKYTQYKSDIVITKKEDTDIRALDSLFIKIPTDD